MDLVLIFKTAACLKTPQFLSISRRLESIYFPVNMDFTALNASPISFSPAFTKFVEYSPLAVKQKKNRLSTKQQATNNNPLPGSKSTQSKPSKYDEKGSMTDTVPIPDPHGSSSLDLNELASPAVTIFGSDPSFFSGMVLLQSIAMYQTLTDTYLQVFSMNIPPPQSRTQNTTAVVTAHWAEGTQITYQVSGRQLS
jgi:hypothetical protein